MKSKNDSPYFYTVKRTENERPVWRTFFAFRLLDIQNLDVNTDMDLQTGKQREKLYKEQVDLINTFYQPDKIHSVEYRLQLKPAKNKKGRNRVEIVIIISIDDAGKGKSIENATALFTNAMHIFQSSSELYSLEPVKNPSVFETMFHGNIYKGDICDIRRRISWLSHKSIVPRLQFGLIKNKESDTQSGTEAEKIVLVHPYIPVKNGYARLFTILSSISHPVLISLRISPTRISKKEEEFLLQNIRLCEDVAGRVPGRSRLNVEQAKILAGVLLSNYLSLQDAPFLLRVMIASSGKIPPGLAELLGTEITKPVGGNFMDIPGQQADLLAGYSGGYDIYFPENVKEKQAYFANLIWHEDHFFQSEDSKMGIGGRFQFLFDASEAASAFHLPYSINNDLTGFPIRWSKVKPIPDELLSTNRKSRSGLIGINNYLGIKRPFYLPDEARRRHVYIVGQTGTGKSSILTSMILSDIENGKGVGVLDPHGDLLDYILLNVPKERMDEVILIDPSVREYAVGVNILENESLEQQNFIIQELISMAKTLFDPGQRHGWAGPIFEDMSRIALRALMNYSGNVPSFIEFPLFFYSENFRNKVISSLEKNDRKWLTDPFIDLSIRSLSKDQDFHSMVSYVVSKYGRIVSDSSLRDILCQEKSTISFEDILNNQKILLVNLNRSVIGSLSSEWLGMFILTKIETAAMKRINQAEKQRKDFYLYIDEFQNSATENFATILSESRKYRLNLTLANQYVSQIPDAIRNAIFGNVGTLIALRVGIMDAELLKDQFAPVFDEEDFIKLPNWKGIVASTATGKRLTPFTMETIPYDKKTKPGKTKIEKLKRDITAKWGRNRRDIATYTRKKIAELLQL